MVTDGILASQAALMGPGSATQGMSSQGAGRFQEAMSRATAQLDATGATNPTNPSNDAMAILKPLLDLNSNSMQLADQAGIAAGQKDLKPGELMMLTMRSHEFLFACELTSNVANRSSDGLQQLFRQQS
jgi:hypothetical protein